MILKRNGIISSDQLIVICDTPRPNPGCSQSPGCTLGIINIPF